MLLVVKPGRHGSMDAAYAFAQQGCRPALRDSRSLAGVVMAILIGTLAVIGVAVCLVAASPRASATHAPVQSRATRAIASSAGAATPRTRQEQGSPTDPTAALKTVNQALRVADSKQEVVGNLGGTQGVAETASNKPRPSAPVGVDTASPDDDFLRAAAKECIRPQDVCAEVKTFCSRSEQSKTDAKYARLLETRDLNPALERRLSAYRESSESDWFYRRERLQRALWKDLQTSTSASNDPHLHRVVRDSNGEGVAVRD